MRAHLIQNNEVINTIAIESIELAQQLFPDHTVIEADQGGPGWRYEDGELLEPLPPVKTTEEIIAEITTATQARLDDFARTRNYDGILSACTYASSAITKFQTEGQYCVNARDNTWATLYTIMGEVEAGTRPMPQSFADVEADLPALAWPL